MRLRGELAVKHALETWGAWAECWEGVLLIRRGQNVAGSRLLRGGLARLSEVAFHLHYTPFLGELAEGLGGAGQVTGGLVVIDDALARAERREERWVAAELLRQKGELLLLGDAATATAQAEDHFVRALDYAGRQGDLSWELRSATSLARLWHQQDRTDSARELLAPIYGRFTEGFDTADLQAARALLAMLV